MLNWKIIEYIDELQKLKIFPHKPIFGSEHTPTQYPGHTRGGIAYVCRRLVPHIPVFTDTLLIVNLRNSCFPCLTCQYTQKF